MSMRRIIFVLAKDEMHLYQIMRIQPDIKVAWINNVREVDFLADPISATDVARHLEGLKLYEVDAAFRTDDE